MTVTPDDFPGTRTEDILELRDNADGNPLTAGQVKYDANRFVVKDNSAVYGPDEVRVSDNDTTPGKLIDKVASSKSTVSFAEDNDGNDENLDINVDFAYGPSATDPVSPSPTDGDIYYNTAINMWMFYDTTRSKFLSIDSDMLCFARQGNTAPGSFFRAGQVAMSSVRGFHALLNGTVVGLGYTRGDADAMTFEVVQDGTSLSTLASSAVSGRSVALNNDFTQGGVLAVKNQSAGNTVSDVTGWVQVRWRV